VDRSKNLVLICQTHYELVVSLTDVDHNNNISLHHDGAQGSNSIDETKQTGERCWLKQIWRHLWTSILWQVWLIRNNADLYGRDETGQECKREEGFGPD
jgi:hypothetical protein